MICEMDQRIDEIKQAVASLVEEHGYSQARVAVLVKVTPPHLSNILSGNVTPNDNTIERIQQRIAEELKKLRGGGRSSFTDLPDVLKWFSGLDAGYRKTVLDAMIATHADLAIAEARPPTPRGISAQPPHRKTGS